MKYFTALSVIAKYSAYLQDFDGTMSEEEAVVIVCGLDLALKAIANHNLVELPPRP
jgi:hypothetical protein